MTDTPEEAVTPKKKGGWPKGRPRVAKAVEREPLKERPTGGAKRWTLKAGANWDSADSNIPEGEDRFHIAKAEIPDGFDLQWVTDSVYGQPMPRERSQFERKGWTPVHQADFDNRFDGRYMPKGADGEINQGGLVLMARPIELTIKARERELRAARDEVRIKEQALYGGELPGVMGADHKSARGYNHVHRTVERIQVPTDEN